MEEKSPATAIRRADGATKCCWKVLNVAANAAATYKAKMRKERDEGRMRANETEKETERNQINKRKKKYTGVTKNKKTQALKQTEQ